MKPRFVAFILTVAAAHADVVTNTLDSGPGSLRQLIADQLRYNTDTITFAPELSGQTITVSSEIRLEFYPGPVTLDASGLPGGLTISGAGGNRLFLVSSSGSLTLHNLTLTGAGNAGLSPIPGVILTYGFVSLTNCTIAGNSGTALAVDRGSVTLTHCTIAGNTGRAVDNFWNGIVTLTHCTIWGNGSEAGGNIYNGFRYPGLTLKNCIVAGSSPPSVDVDNNGWLFRQGANIIPTIRNGGQIEYPAQESGPPALTSGPLLAPLGDYGGSTKTMAVLPGSPARDAAVGSTAASDQRGYPIVGTPDIGAYEAGTPANYNAWIYEALPATAGMVERGAAFDFDGDGQSNGDEFVFLTNPGSSASFFAPQATREGDSLRILFASVTGRSYSLQQNNTLAPSLWNNAPGQSLITGDGSVRSFIVPMDGPHGFFRLLVAP